MAKRTEWNVSDLTDSIDLKYHYLEVEADGEWHHFHIVATPDRVVFGSICNIGFMESGYMLWDEEYESLDYALQELVDELETYYRDGREFTNRIVCNERM